MNIYSNSDFVNEKKRKTHEVLTIAPFIEFSKEINFNRLYVTYKQKFKSLPS